MEVFTSDLFQEKLSAAKIVPHLIFLSSPWERQILHRGFSLREYLHGRLNQVTWGGSGVLQFTQS